MHFEKRVAECGMPVYVCEMPHVESTACGVLLHAGTAHESWPNEAGLAHAFEHMVFEGNNRFKTSKAVSAHIEEVGGMCNAFTSKSVTFFDALVPYYELRRSIGWLFHLLSSPRLLGKHVVTEMKNVISEVKQRDDNPNDFSRRKFVETVYGSHPLGRDILGIEDSVRAFKRDDFFRYYDRLCHVHNFSFIVAGNADTETVLSCVNSYNWRRTNSAQPKLPRCTAPQKQNIVFFERSDLEQVHVHFGTCIIPTSQKELTALQLFAIMIGGGMSFPLFQEVRGRHGLCYSIYSEVMRSSQSAVFHVFAGTDKDGCHTAVRLIKDIIKKSAHDERLFRRAKKLVKGNMALQYEGSSSVLSAAVAGIVFRGRPLSPEEALKEIEDITFDEVQQVCATYLNTDMLTEVYLIPKGFKL